MAKEFAFAFGVLFAVSTVIRAMIPHSKWRALVPGGIAVAVGMSAYLPLHVSLPSLFRTLVPGDARSINLPRPRDV